MSMNFLLNGCFFLLLGATLPRWATGADNPQEIIVLNDSKAFSGFSVDDIDAAHTFYTTTLGLTVTKANGMLTLELAGDRPTLVYPKGEGHVPASYTILNFPVEDIDQTVAELTARGVEFEKYEGTPGETDPTGVFRKGGPLIAWFTDPAGNILSIIQQD